METRRKTGQAKQGPVHLWKIALGTNFEAEDE